MAPRKKRNDFWDTLTLLVPYHFTSAATEAAHRCKMPVTEYCRMALLLRLEADGVRLDDHLDRAA